MQYRSHPPKGKKHPLVEEPDAAAPVMDSIGSAEVEGEPNVEMTFGQVDFFFRRAFTELMQNQGCVRLQPALDPVPAPTSTVIRQTQFMPDRLPLPKDRPRVTEDIFSFAE